MSENERAWYQNGETTLVVTIGLCIVVYFGLQYFWELQDQQKLVAVISASATIERAFQKNPVWKVKVWHQCPGILRNGQLIVTVESDQLAKPNGEQFKMYSFEEWSPNEGNGVDFEFPLQAFDLEQEMPIKFELSAKNAKPYIYRDAWFGRGWKSNQD